MLVPFLPNDQMSGGQTRWYNLIKHLSQKHKITLMTLIKDDWEKKFIPELNKYCEKVYIFRRPKSPWTFRNLLLTLVSFNPLVVIRNFSFNERRAIKKELNTQKYDIIHAETFYVMPHIPATKTPIVLVEPTIEFSVYQHYVNREVPWYLKPIYQFDVAKLRYWEKFYWRRATRLFAVSDDDKNIMNSEVQDLNIGVIPNGVDINYFNSKSEIVKKNPTILYVGNFKWMQNVEAVNILVSELWPKIKNSVQNAKLWLTGVNMPPILYGYAKNDPDIKITESLPDIREAYKGSTVLVAPIKGPGGTRLKVLEALASGLPVISTPVGVAGLGIESGKHALVTSDMNELVDFTVRLLKNKEFAVKIGEAGKKFVTEKFDWKNIVSKLDKVYEEITK